MSQDHLGLFDTPWSRQRSRVGFAIIGLLLAVLVLTWIVPDVRIGQIEPFIPMVDATTSLIDLIIAAQLYAQAGLFRSRALTVLASGYVLSALIIIPHALTFPGAFAPNGLLGAGVSTTAWLYIFWRGAIPIAVILYVLFNRADCVAQARTDRQSAAIAVGIGGAIALTIALTSLTTRGHDLLPLLFHSRSEANYANFLSVNLVLIALLAVAAALLLRHLKSMLDMWLLIVLAAWLIQTITLLSFHGRFTVGWYAAIAMILLSHLFLMLALIVESSRLYARLARSTAARNREREARLMTIDGVAAAISHEVGQPLTAVTANASAGLSWLTRDQPDPDMAIKHLNATLEAGYRSFDVIRSIRAMFAQTPTAATEINLNDLVHETVSLLDNELTGEEISLRLALDETLLPIQADRVQMQRVLVNLVNNAIESLSATQDRSRRIAIRSAQDDQKVLLEVSDTGIGIAPEEMPHIFDAFFTTKATGTGLGLALCRTIIENHGGRLWASPGDGYGATFCLQLPRRELHPTSL